jgi:hypothetical protein
MQRANLLQCFHSIQERNHARTIIAMRLLPRRRRNHPRNIRCSPPNHKITHYFLHKLFLVRNVRDAIRTTQERISTLLVELDGSHICFVGEDVASDFGAAGVCAFGFFRAAVDVEVVDWVFVLQIT